jgi:general secretion pathway protein K
MVLRDTEAERRGGFVLVAVLILVVLLEVVLLEFSREAELSLRASGNHCRSQQALYCAEAGVKLAAEVLSRPELAGTHEAMNQLFADAGPFVLGPGECTVTVVQENGKINVNLLKDEEGNVNRALADRMLRLIDVLNLQVPEDDLISYELVPCIMDWVDEDDEVTVLPFVQRENKGAEGDHYERLEPPYPCKNARLDIVSELLLVKEMTPGLFFGGQVQQDGGVTVLPAMREYLTVYGDGKININYASAAVLQSLSEDIGPDVAQAIIEWRVEEPFRNVAQLASVPGMTPAVHAAIREHVVAGSEERYFQVTSTGTSGQARRTVRAIVTWRDSRPVALLREEPYRVAAQGEGG